jgi:hypothetical protein
MKNQHQQAYPTPNMAELPRVLAVPFLPHEHGNKPQGNSSVPFILRAAIHQRLNDVCFASGLRWRLESTTTVFLPPLYDVVEARGSLQLIDSDTGLILADYLANASKEVATVNKKGEAYAPTLLAQMRAYAVKSASTAMLYRGFVGLIGVNYLTHPIFKSSNKSPDLDQAYKAWFSDKTQGDERRYYRDWLTALQARARQPRGSGQATPLPADALPLPNHVVNEGHSVRQWYEVPENIERVYNSLYTVASNAGFASDEFNLDYFMSVKGVAPEQYESGRAFAAHLKGMIQAEAKEMLSK